jgi:protein-tyrosine phosphatase
MIHTLGHGRSACVMCAILVALGIAQNWKDAENIIRERRKIKMNALHRKNLEDWSKHRVAKKKEN